ncbi:MAG: alpha/beta fold hydrolase [Planctomycetes bacterium]|nr:alpha/beta fold hydrolase [Planctomycetota bacterium]
MVRFSGHFWTLYPYLRGQVGLRAAPPATRWEGEVVDEVKGRVPLSGRWRESAERERAIVLVHGLGGGPESFYVREAELEFARRGWSVLNLALRGADLAGIDFYHGASSVDVHAALASPTLAHHHHLHVVGFSIGGHIALHVARETAHPRVRSVVAVCAPLHLPTARAAIDSPRALLYRRHVLRGCKAVYAAVARRSDVPTPQDRVARARTVQELDELTVVPRYGFADAQHYYESMSVAPHLPHLHVPALLVNAPDDPMVASAAVLPWLPPRHGLLRVSTARRGGHVGFPGDLDLGVGGSPGLYAQLDAWLRRQEP